MNLSFPPFPLGFMNNIPNQTSKKIKNKFSVFILSINWSHYRYTSHYWPYSREKNNKCNQRNSCFFLKVCGSLGNYWLTSRCRASQVQNHFTTPYATFTPSPCSHKPMHLHSTNKWQIAITDNSNNENLMPGPHQHINRFTSKIPRSVTRQTYPHRPRPSQTSSKIIQHGGPVLLA